MKFSQKLVCVMLTVIVAFFALGGSALLYGDFSDRLASAAQEEQARHGMVCYAVENEILSLHRLGDAVDAAALGAACQAAVGRGGAAGTRLRDGDGNILYDDLPEGWSADAPGAGQVLITNTAGRFWRVYASELIDGYTLVSAFDLTEIFDARSRSLRRFFLLEAAVMAGAAVVIWLASRTLTRPLALLSAASGRIAAGDYALRTNIRSGDEIGQLSRRFDRMAAAVQEKVEALELSVKQREDFMGAFTHELKTPMTGIIGYSDMLRTIQPDPDEQREAAGAIFHEAKRLEKLSVKLLQLMHLSEEALVLDPTPLDPLIRSAARSASPVLHGCTVRMRPGHLTVMADADLLTDLILNLITNAAKAGDDRPIYIDSRADDTGEWVVLRVMDRGCGIPPEQIARVVEPFYMVDKSRARKQGGSGLGLALCVQIAAAHGGRLNIESEVGRGTIVSVTLRPAPAKGGTAS